jgi:hypothetical protein
MFGFGKKSSSSSNEELEVEEDSHARNVLEDSNARNERIRLEALQGRSTHTDAAVIN